MRLIPITKPDANKMRACYELADDLVVFHELGSLIVPGGFQFDGASIPRIVWPLIGSPFDPPYMRAALAHDWLYHTHARFDRERTDALFCALLVEDGVSQTRASLMHTAVRMFGRAYWGNDDADLQYLQRLRERIAHDHRNPADYGL